MRITNLKKLFLILFIVLSGCNPCDDNGDNIINSKYIYFQSVNQDNKNIIFRFNIENFKVKEIISDFMLGRSNNLSKSIYFNPDSIFILDNNSLKSELIFEKVPGIKVDKVYLSKNSENIIILSQDSALYKTDLSNNIELIENKVETNKLSLNSYNIVFWKNHKQTINILNIQNSYNTTKSFNFEYENRSNISFSNENICFSNYNDTISKIYHLDYNLNITDSTILNKGNCKPVIIDKEIYYFDEKSIFTAQNTYFECSENEKIENIYFNSKNNITFVEVSDKISNEKTFYYSTNANNLNFILLINNAKAID